MKMRFSSTLWMLSQYSFLEKIDLLLAHYSNVIPPEKRKMLFESKDVFQYIKKNKYLSKKRGDKNIINVSNDPAMGCYSVVLRRMTSDFAVYRQIMIHKDYQSLVDKIKEDSNTGAIRYIIDAGANIGCSAVFFKKSFPVSRVIAIEPDLNNFNMMLENIQLNGFGGIEALNSAIWVDDEDLEISRNFRDGQEWSFTVAPASESEGDVIRGITIDGIMAKYSFPCIDILKMDIEGAERFIFESSERVKSFLPKVRYLALEVHDEFNIMDKILNILGEYNFTYFQGGENIMARNEDFDPALA